KAFLELELRGSHSGFLRGGRNEMPVLPRLLPRPAAEELSAKKGTIMRTKRLTLQQRREIFLDLVQTQDENTMSVPESRQSVIKKLKMTDMQLRQIEEEGSDKDWPPLNQPMQKVG